MTKRRTYYKKEIAAELGVSEKTVSRLYADGMLPGAYKNSDDRNARLKMDEVDLLRFKEERKARNGK